MDLRRRLDEAIARWALLQHPFYQAWTAGTLPRAALATYAKQYRHHVEAFPTYVSAVHARCGGDLAARRSLLSNLVEEEGGERNHAALWADFAEGLGLSREEVLAAPAEPPVRALIETFRGLTQRPAGEGAAALYAYESQVPAVASAKVDGLRENYGLTEARTLAFFELHRTVDVWHSDETAAIAERLSAHPERTVETAAQAARALWTFLDAMPRA